MNLHIHKGVIRRLKQLEPDTEVTLILQNGMQLKGALEDVCDSDGCVLLNIAGENGDRPFFAIDGDSVVAFTY